MLPFVTGPFFGHSKVSSKLCPAVKPNSGIWTSKRQVEALNQFYWTAENFGGVPTRPWLQFKLSFHGDRAFPLLPSPELGMAGTRERCENTFQESTMSKRRSCVP